MEVVHPTCDCSLPPHSVFARNNCKKCGGTGQYRHIFYDCEKCKETGYYKDTYCECKFGDKIFKKDLRKIALKNK